VRHGATQRGEPFLRSESVCGATASTRFTFARDPDGGDPTIRILLSSLLGFDEGGYRDRLDQAPACLNVLDFRDAVHVRLMLFNDTSHYSERPRVSTQNLSKWWDEKR
jgi:hypothetical protein